MKKILRNASLYQLTSRDIKWVIIPPFLVALILTLLSSPAFFDLHPYLWGENKIVETIQFPIFILAGIQSLTIAWGMLVQVERTLTWGFYLAFAFVMFFVALEEIAWGQQYLGFRSPDIFREINVQNEFTFHNIPLLQDKTDILNLGFGLFGLIGFILAGSDKFRKISVPGILVPWFILIVALSAVGVWVNLFVGKRPINYSIHIQTETAELLIGLVGCIFPWLNYRRFVIQQHGYTQVAEVSISGGKIHLDTGDGRVILIPIKNILHLDDGDKKAIERVRIKSNGTVVFWPDLDRQFSVHELLKPINREVGEALGAPSLLGKVYGWFTFASGIISMIWLALVPGDPKNAWLLGFSKTRLLMIIIGLGCLSMIGLLMFNRKKNPEKVQELVSRLGRCLGKPLFRITTVIAVVVGITGSFILLIATYLHPDPSIRGLFLRLAPLFFWLLVSLIEVFALVLFYMLSHSRSRMARADKLSFDKDSMVFSIIGDYCVTVPIGWYPALINADGLERENIVFLGDGLKVVWPLLKVEILVESLLRSQRYKIYG